MANDKFTAKIADLQKFRHRAAEEQEAAIKTAVEKATGELQNSATQPTVPAPSEELLKKHAEELRALEARLKAEHEAALQAAVAAAAAAAASPSTSTHDQNAAIDAAVAAKEAELQAMHQEAIAKAMESGRLEGAFKLKVKDGQMVKTQRRLKELEAQIEEWKKAGVVPATWTLADAAALTASPNTSAPPSTAAPPTTTASLATAAPLATTAPPAQHKTEPTARGGAPGLPRRPTLNAPVASGSAPAPTAATERGRGRGRGVARGMSIRGAAAPGVGRGGNVSIMGAAAKRAREENDGGAEGALVKRLKPADGAEGEGASVSAPAPTPAPRGGKPVQLQRNRVGPS
ncbi:hypothetical protein BV25DRAFT_684100 [Artomyces pyxidatus]|uniref:Uncharacterized protein n=1 Tax=Artomyces pyxidatus TaxID=48021 RepID=A0ACB8T129_9AGAM|nr:hypothetical protein BV25DRAFT_684100 [Artomyces pyxidatus]